MQSRLWSAVWLIIISALLRADAGGSAARPTSLAPKVEVPLPGATPPSILVIIADDVAWSEREHLPSLNRLASAGMTFTRHVGFPTCCPTRYGLMFGRYPRRDGIGDVSLNPQRPNDDKMPTGNVSLARHFAPTHRTVAVGKWHLGRAELIGAMNQVTSGPFVQGFEQWVAGNAAVPGDGSGATGFYLWNRADRGKMELSSEYATDAQRDAFLETWTPAEGPQFTYLAWSAAHDSPTGVWETPPGGFPASTRRGQYLEVVRYLDGAIDNALDAVDLSTTYVVFLGDNGTPELARPSEPPGVWKGSTITTGVRTPLIVAGPGIIPGSTSSRLVSVVDIAATLAELVGRPIARGFEDSRSFANELNPTLWEGTEPRTFVFTERYDVVESGAGGYPQPTGWDSQAIYEDRWAYIIQDDDGDGPGGKVERVYSLALDPQQLVPYDLADLPRHLSPSERQAILTAGSRMRSALATIVPRAPLPIRSEPRLPEFHD